MKLDGNQDALIAAVAAANPHTVVVLETNAGVAMPWAERVPAIIEAWYPGQAGGKAIANVLTGQVNPSGHLPVTFYASEAQLPRPVRPGTKSEMDEFTLPYSEGAAVGYKWIDRTNAQPLFSFGHGLSYTIFDYGPISAAPAANGAVRVQFTLRNSGSRSVRRRRFGRLAITGIHQGLSPGKLGRRRGAIQGWASAVRSASSAGVAGAT